MKRFPTLCCVLVAVAAAYGANGVSKTGTVVATFLEIPVGAPAIGMGDAFVSIANDASALYWNPAGIAWFSENQGFFQHTTWIADMGHDYAALVVPLGSFGVLGGSFTSLSMGDMKVRTVEKPEGTGEYFSASDFALGVSYARQLTDRFGVGFTGKYIQETIWHESAHGFAVDVGTVFRTDLFGGMVIGATLSNFGTSMQMTGLDTREYISVESSQLGTNDEIPSDIETDSWDLPLQFRFGVSTTPVKTDIFRWTVAVDAVHPNDDYESMDLGTELAYNEFLFLRGGFHSLFLPDREGGLSLGVGFKSTSVFDSGVAVRFDYAYRNMGRLENIHVISVGVGF